MTQNILKWIGAAVAVAFGWFSNLPDVVRLLLVVMALDILAGVSVAIITKRISSKAAVNGVGKKAVTLIVIALTYTVMNPIVGVLATPIGDTVAGWYVFAEVVSILEKADVIGVPIPEFLRKALNNLNPDDDSPLAKG